MGRVTTAATIENRKDLWEVESGLRPADQARRHTVPDALVETGATILSLPTALIQALGLRRVTSKRVTSSRGDVVEVALYEAVRLTIQCRTCTIDVLEVPDNVPALMVRCPWNCSISSWIRRAGNSSAILLTAANTCLRCIDLLHRGEEKAVLIHRFAPPANREPQHPFNWRHPCDLCDLFW